MTTPTPAPLPFGKKLADTLTVCGQITPAQVAEIAKAGFHSIVCHRFDEEDMGQADFEVIAHAAKAHGLVAVHQPVASGHVTEQDGAKFAQIYEGLPKPVFAYCRSGTRCAKLWDMMKKGN